MKKIRTFNLIIFATILLLVSTQALFSQQADTTITKLSEITQSLDLLGWILLFLGWIMYWLKKLDDKRIENKAKGAPFLQGFIPENIIEVPVSFLSCLTLALLAPYIPTDIIDLHGYLSLYMVGFGGSSILNGLITKAKPKS